MKKIFIAILFLSIYTSAQDLTGRWVAITDLDSGYYAELYLIQNSENVYAGHCYDTQEGGYCRHWLDAKFDPETQEFFGLDMELISKSEHHAPTDYILQYKKGDDGKEYLIGSTSPAPYNMRPRMLGLPSKQDLYSLRFQILDGVNAVRYVKVEDNYKIYNYDMPLAMTAEQIILEKSAFSEVFQNVTKPIEAGKPSTLIEDSSNQNTSSNSTGMSDEKSLATVKTATSDISNDELEYKDPSETVKEIPQAISEPTIQEKRVNRTDKLLSHVQFKTKKVTLLIRDYGTVDNDTVTIFFNNKIIAENLRIESNAAEFNLELIQGERNELVFVANNLGDVAPNTAKITLIADKKRYNYKLFTDEENNALIILENVNAP